MTYVHGYSREERQRLVAQADYWRRLLPPQDLPYHAGDRLLEIGCAVGATVRVLGTAFPGLRLAGIDQDAASVAFAREHLAGLGLGDVDLRVGDARELPWAEESFDHVYIIWLLEHVTGALPFLREARRVLKPGGSIALTETDYSTFQVHPASPDYDYLRDAQFDLFRRNGNPVVGRMLGPLLVSAGFHEVSSGPRGFHSFGRPGDDGLRGHVEYMAEFMEPAIARMVADLGRDEERLRRGLAFLRRVPDAPEGSFTQIVYRATARK